MTRLAKCLAAGVRRYASVLLNVYFDIFVQNLILHIPAESYGVCVSRAHVVCLVKNDNFRPRGELLPHRICRRVRRQSSYRLHHRQFLTSATKTAIRN